MSVRPRLTILVKLAAAYVIPAAALFAGFAYLVHDVARRDLEAELGARLAAVAGATSTHIRDASLARLEPGDEDDSRYQRCRAVLEAVAKDTSVARLYVFNRARKSVCDSAIDMPIGGSYYHLGQDATELRDVFDKAIATSSVLFEGADGKLYKAGYAPARLAASDDGDIALAVGVEAPVDFFDRLAALRRTLLAYGCGLALVVLLVSVVVAARITRPLRALAQTAERIGHGDWSEPVEVGAADEIGLLSRTMERMRAELQERDQRLQLMLSGIAHEVRNPLGGIALFTGLLREELADDASEALGHVRRIEKEMSYLEAVVNDFLDYARRPPPDLVEVELSELTDEVTALVASDAREGGVSITSTTAKGPCLADRGQLRRALLNLLRNAVQACTAAGGGTVEIRARRTADTVDIEIFNQGRPIPEQVRSRLFDPFVTTKEKGTGLGLALVAEIVRDHGGTIDFHSDDEGTTFCLRLPWRPS